MKKAALLKSFELCFRRLLAEMEGYGVDAELAEILWHKATDLLPVEGRDEAIVSRANALLVIRAFTAGPECLRAWRMLRMEEYVTTGELK